MTHPVLDAVLGVRADRSNVTAEDRIIEVARTLGYVEHAAAAAGVPKRTVYNLLESAARAQKAIFAGERTRKSLTARERREIKFADDLNRAIGEATAAALARITAAGQGGHAKRTVTEIRGPSPGVDANGREIPGPLLERRVKEDVLAPEPKWDAWRLERRFPGTYGRTRLEVSGPDGEPVPVELRAKNLAARLAAIQTGLTADEEHERPDVEPQVDVVDDAVGL